jgi:hypothetical protein
MKTNQIAQPGHKAGKAWADDEIAVIKQAINSQNVDIGSLSTQLGRSAFAVAIKAAKFGFVVTEFAAELEIFFEKEKKRQVEREQKRGESPTVKMSRIEKEMLKSKLNLYSLLLKKGSDGFVGAEKDIFFHLAMDQQVQQHLEKAVKPRVASSPVH